MLQRMLILLAALGVGYWYWSGPYQEKVNPAYGTIIKQNDENMAKCTRAAAYKLGATGSGPGEEEAEQHCAEKFGLYEQDGHWLRYDMTNPD